MEMVSETNSGPLEKRHPITVEQKSVNLALNASRGSQGLNHEQRSLVEDFIGNYRTKGKGQLKIEAPSGGANEQAAYQIAAEVRDIAQSAGIPAHAIAVDAYGGDGGKPPVKLSYVGYVAEGPVCGLWPDNLTEDPRNEAYANFGCAQQQNLAAMIDNPQDLVEMRGSYPRSSERRDVMWDKWLKGQSTIAQKKSEEKATSTTKGN